ncbi:MAG: hypothetical protein COB60_07805 [Flavobacteriaceae bacterium]|nr:MAG: hypothetical protein COB60_07805 [Flavobacteriaceae bacterium]
MEQNLYICLTRNIETVDLETRKYHFIQELFSIDKDKIMTALERVLKHEKEEHHEISIMHKKELDNRLENYKKNPDDVLDWKDVKGNW